VRPLRIGLLSYELSAFNRLSDVCIQAGHQPVVYVCARGLVPGSKPTSDISLACQQVLDGAPGDIDILLPGSTNGLAAALTGYKLDLAVCCYFRWKLPPSVLGVTRLGSINIHASLLPKYRGPIPVHWAIRSGDPSTGITVHWMDERFDSGRIIVQTGGVELDEDPVAERIFGRIDSLMPRTLAAGLEKICNGYEGAAQPEDIEYFGWMEPSFSNVDWTRDCKEVHNQVRTFRFATSCTRGPKALIAGRYVEIIRTSLAPVAGERVECRDGPIWIADSIAVDPNSNTPIPWISGQKSRSARHMGPLRAL
jgi:methionyl-tRNA formyltransferase